MVSLVQCICSVVHTSLVQLSFVVLCDDMLCAEAIALLLAYFAVFRCLLSGVVVLLAC